MSLVHSATAQWDVINALVLRETRAQYAESRLGYLWALAEPTMWVLMFYAAFVLGGRGSALHGMDVLPFLATGVCTYRCFLLVSGSVPAKLPRHLLAIPHVTALDVFIANASLRSATMSLVFLALVGGATLISGEAERTDDPLLVVAGMALAALLGFGFSLLLSAAARVSKLTSIVRTVLTRLLFWTSGMFFVAEDLPTGVRDIMLYNPILHAVELVRGGWFTTYRAVYVDGPYAVGFALVLLLAGLSCEQLTRERSL